MPSKTTRVDAKVRDRLTHALQESLSRRDLGRYATAAAALAAVGPGRVAAQSASGTPAPSRPTGGSITVARPWDGDSLDPHHTSGPSYEILQAVYDPLVGFTAKRTYEGILAESWDVSADGLEYTFRLRDGITFHNGEAMNADAVKFTFDRLIDPATSAPAAGWVTPLKATTVVDPLTVKLRLSESFSPLLANFCFPYYGILPPGAVQQLGENFGKQPVGTGPWKFKEWVTGETITLERNETYRNFHTYMENRGAPYLDRLVFAAIPEPQTREAALETGEVHVIDIPNKDFAQFQANADYQVYAATESANLAYIEFSMVKPDGEYGAVFKPPFDDIRLRQAIAYGINVDEIVEKVLYGRGTRNYGPIPTVQFAYNPAIEQYGYHFDQTKAKSLLDQAGWVAGSDGVRQKDGARLELFLMAYDDGGTNQKAVQVFQSRLAELGMKVSVGTLEIAAWVTKRTNGDFNIDISGFSWPDPHILKMVAAGNDGGFSLYRDEEYISLLDQGARTSDLKERAALYFKAGQKLLTDAAMVPLWSPLVSKAVRKEVKDYRLGPHAYGAYEDAYIAK
jgi:peptide/nickel transport system substrate-binding protein